jgi:2'-5' RNA ligase
MSLEMSSLCGGGRTLGQFALVSYLPDPLASYLDRLRLDLDPDCSPHAHVTVLPPRPMSAEISQAITELNEESHEFPPFEVELGDAQIFPVSNVIYIELAKGQSALFSLHDRLERGSLKYQCRFEFHPHITIGQNLDPGHVEEALRAARARWSAYIGPRTFVVDSLSFVQNVAPDLWLDLARIPLAVPVPAGS